MGSTASCLGSVQNQRVPQRSEVASGFGVGWKRADWASSRAGVFL